MKIGNKIREIRIGNKIDQGELARLCGISQAYLSQIENNNRHPNIAILKKISANLNIPFAVLCYLVLEVDDIPENKKQAFQLLNPSILSLIKSVYIG
jgi:XRE family transcriptional regulator, regulator of sulfur utilization